MSLAKSPSWLLTVAAMLAFVVSADAATLEVTGPPGASVVVNGHDLGVLPLAAPLELAPGHYVIESRLTGYIAFDKTVHLDREDSWVTVQVRLDRLKRGTAWRSNVLFAGLGQHYVGHRGRGYFYNAAEAAGLIAALVGEVQRSNHRNDYLEIIDQYNRAINADDATRLREEAEASYSDMQDAENLRDTGLMVAVGAIVVSIADVLLTFPNVAAGPGPVPPTTGALELAPQSYDLSTVHVGVRFEF